MTDTFLHAEDLKQLTGASRSDLQIEWLDKPGNDTGYPTDEQLWKFCEDKRVEAKLKEDWTGA